MKEIALICYILLFPLFTVVAISLGVVGIDMIVQKAPVELTLLRAFYEITALTGACVILMLLSIGYYLLLRKVSVYDIEDIVRKVFRKQKLPF